MSNVWIIEVGDFATEVSGLRDLHAADCVVLLTNGDYGDFLGLTPNCGPSDGNSFSIVQVGAALSRMTFSHELGHQFGCKHSPGNNNGSCEPDFERPYEFRCGGFLNNKLRITLMEAGETGFNWKVESLPAGLYQIQVATQRSVSLQRVAIIH